PVGQTIAGITGPSPGHDVRLLGVEPPDLDGLTAAPHPPAGPDRRGEGAHPEVGTGAARELEGEEAVVVGDRPGPCRRDLRVHALRSPEEDVHLVEEMSAEVEEQPAPRFWGGLLTPGLAVDLRTEALETALNAEQAAQQVALERLAQQQKVAVPPPGLKDPEQGAGACGWLGVATTASPIPAVLCRSSSVVASRRASGKSRPARSRRSGLAVTIARTSRSGAAATSGAWKTCPARP